MFNTPYTIAFLLATLTLFNSQQTDSWLGKWTGEDSDGVGYVIKVDDKYRGENLCEIEVAGIQVFYRLECRAVGNPSMLKIYYRSTIEGAFYAGDRVKINEPFMTLKREKGKVICQWRQIQTDHIRLARSR